MTQAGVSDVFVLYASNAGDRPSTGTRPHRVHPVRQIDRWRDPQRRQRPNAARDRKPAHARKEQGQVSQPSMSTVQHQVPGSQIDGQTTWTSRKRVLTPYLSKRSPVRPARSPTRSRPWPVPIPVQRFAVRNWRSQLASEPETRAARLRSTQGESVAVTATWRSVTHFAACAKPPFLSRLSRSVNDYTGPVSTPTAAAEPRRQSRERQVNTATGLSVRQQFRVGTKASDSMFEKPFNGSGTKALPRPSGEKIGSVIAIAVENT